MRAQPDLGLPSMTRVIVAVVVTLGLAGAALVVLKRYMPGIAVRRTPGGLIKVLGRAHVTANLQVHVLEIEAARVLVVEGRRGLTVTLLPGVSPPPTAPPNAIRSGADSRDSNQNTDSP
jgi:flagellar biogenesis protein FliO